MLHPIKVVDIELSEPISTLTELAGYMGVQGLVRLYGVPLGYVRAPVTLGECSGATLSELILAQLGSAIITQLLKNGLASPKQLESLKLEELIDLPPVEYDGEWPLVTIAVCTRDRPEDIRRCLDAISQLDYPQLDVLVVDNAPQTEATKALIAADYPQVRYVQEPNPGLDWARNRAILEAKGEIIAYTDDDVVVDAGWVKAIAQVFENENVMAVTGLVVPYELETEAQVLFEAYGGFGKGFDYQEYWVPDGQPIPWWMTGAGQYGTGANMAYRRSIFKEIGGFDPALDVGTVTNGGGDLEMFFRVVESNNLLAYVPTAMVRHCHRRSYEKLKTQIASNGIGFYAYWACGMACYPESFFQFLTIGLYWFVSWHLRRAWISFKHPTKVPAELVWAELKGSFVGLFRYAKARRQVEKVANDADDNERNSQSPGLSHIEQYKQRFRRLPELTQELTKSTDQPSQESPDKKQGKQKLVGSIAVRHVRLESSLQPITDVEQYSQVRVFFSWQGHPLCARDITNGYKSIGVSTLEYYLLSKSEDTDSPETILYRLLDLDPNDDRNPYYRAYAVLSDRYSASANLEKTNLEKTNLEKTKLPKGVKVSINLATFDRPDDLRNCLTCLQAQKTDREVEIVVVDNHPSSNLTPPIVADFPEVKLVRETRQGLAYARNAGFSACTGDIIIATDDDVTIPEDWLEKLVAPFVRADVMIVTGNVLPLQLETPSQQFFEKYGGLGRGFVSQEVNADWFEESPRYAIPTWSLGATANAAFRASIFSVAEIGLMDEALGPGMPSGVGEDTYLFYKTIKAGYTLLYEPSAYLWHKHRQDNKALRRQLYGYSKGHVSYNLTTWLRDGDWRGLYQIFVGLPTYHAYRIVKLLLRKSDYPLSLILLEIWGNLAGPWSLWRSRLRVSKEGRSEWVSHDEETSDAYMIQSQ
ncbi:glycosyl transferase, group 2 family protein [Synechococcus sp. PCC 7335]|uniref:glycosyltransferase family 2 protein n=1 Tax=Synechococcus sp. (strain ATCC 29403 / PCC 7335) TaxID=91464 RepID=UPI00017ED53C|nr:glycosyltransferase family 2 protein [Synechococcus sp. PCC 7335]EDX85742.1 glycosyl transferase, group 2 family protein [Synechococcus sp. PCC 7335]